MVAVLLPTHTGPQHPRVLDYSVSCKNVADETNLSTCLRHFHNANFTEADLNNILGYLGNYEQPLGLSDATWAQGTRDMLKNLGFDMTSSKKENGANRDQDEIGELGSLFQKTYTVIVQIGSNFTICHTPIIHMLMSHTFQFARRVQESVLSFSQSDPCSSSLPLFHFPSMQLSKLSR